MEEKQIRFGVSSEFGRPTVDDGSIAKIGGDGFESCPRKGVAEAGIHGGRETKTSCHYWIGQLKICKKNCRRAKKFERLKSEDSLGI